MLIFFMPNIYAGLSGVTAGSSFNQIILLIKGLVTYWFSFSLAALVHFYCKFFFKLRLFTVLLEMNVYFWFYVSIIEINPPTQ